jgi:hypothetical protein
VARLRQLSPDGEVTGPATEIVGGLTLGRAPDCDVVLDDVQISRHHARVSAPGPECVVEDLGSANGVFVGQERVARATVAPGQPFRIGSTWFVVEADPTAAAEPAPAPPPARGHGRLVGCSVLGCLGLVLLLAAGLAWYLWTCCAPPSPAAGTLATPPPAGAGAGGAAPSAAPPASVPLSEADVLRFTLRVASNPVLAGCAAMPQPWQPPLVEVPLAARVAADGAFRFARDWTDASGDHHVEGTGTWKDGALDARGRWTTRRAAGAATQEDEGSFTAAGRQLLGSWFGDRITAEFTSRLGDASCREPIANGLSRIDELKW